MKLRECDLVMKGGITSGVVYAGAIVELGREFRFRRIGGTSAGAIGAAVAAAAEYARCRDGRPGMAERFQRLVEDVSTRGHFPSLLQPVYEGRPVIDVGLALLRQDHRPWRRLVAALSRVVRARWWIALAVAVVAAAAVWLVVGDEGVSVAATAVFVALVVLGAVLLTVVGPLLLVGIAARRALRRAENGFGLCSGIATGPEPALTDWLHATIQRIAELDSSRPLTFAQLDDAGIELAMVTTDLGAAHPVRLPLRSGDEVGYWYDATDMRALFPRPVCEYLDSVAGEANELGLRRLPCLDLPVIVALRMSLSVPLLLACVPLYPARGDEGPSRGRRSWFTDGGVTSNFPIHFFDTWLPRRPTFGLDLRPVASKEHKRVHLPGPEEPAQPRWEDVDGDVSLIRQIADAAQNWRDTAQAELPGFRDRVCQVRLYPGEGGMHLNMPPEKILELIEAGREAGRCFVREFDEQRMRCHQARRYLILMRLLQANLHEARAAFVDVRPVLDGSLPDDPAYLPPFLRLARRATDRLLRWQRAPRRLDFERGIEATPPPAMRIGPST